MKIKVIHESKIKKVKIDSKMSVAKLAKKLDVILPNYIVKLNNKIVPEDEMVKDGDTIEFFKVISGG
ncbi:MAG: MoaD/ThiS family protein [bacterium]